MNRLAQLLSRSPAQISKSMTKPQFRYGTIDKYLNRLNYPLYFYIIGANVAVFSLWQMPFMDKIFLFNNFTMNRYSLQTLHFWNPLTYAFSHNQFMPLVFNMVTLYFFGRTVEAYFGSRRMLMVYLVGALAGALAIQSQGSTYMGAAGPVNAMLTYYICNFPRETILLFFIPVPAWVVGLIVLGQSYFSSAQGREVHLAGALSGVAYHFATRGRI